MATTAFLPLAGHASTEFWDMTTGCLGRPIPPTNPQRPLDVGGVPPVLVVGNTHGPATLLRWARSLASHIRGPCATGRIDDYLVSGALPPAGTVCR
ncbi:alpha/beta hydrolase [Nonomuraea helvata]|uniref:Alpha/beta hydrolase n=1 Tax=Nonomuraea helvata TaxID=37484 RepID=A0ABV5SFU9_9ACTN